MRKRTLMAACIAVTVATTQASASDPTTGDCLAASEKSAALRKGGKLRAARAELLVCASRSCPADIRKECLRRADEVNQAVPTVVFGAKDAAGNDVTSVTVKMDGEPLLDRLEGAAISLDPGVHTFEFVASGHRPLKREFVIREGEKERREVIQLDPPASPGPAVAPPAARPPASEPPPPSPGLGGQRTVALVVLGVGVLGVVAGGVFGVMSVSKNGDARAVCPNAGCPTQDGVDQWDTARTFGNVSTIAFAAGGGALAAGLLLWVTGAPRAAGPRTGLAVGPGALTFKGAF